MGATPTLDIKPEPDGCGYYYGWLTVGTEQYRVDLLPPIPLYEGHMELEKVDPEFWVIHVDGMQLARVKTREEATAEYIAGRIKS